MISRHHRSLSRARAFTLIEIMIVVAIIGIVMTAGIPLMWRALSKNDLARGVNDVMEGCKAARDRAILEGVPYEFVIRENGSLEVSAAPREQRPASSSAANVSPKVPPPSSPNGTFPRKLGENVAVQLIDVNFVDLMKEDSAHVRFFPNGTSDEFTIVLSEKGVQRVISLDVVTGLPEEVKR